MEEFQLLRPDGSLVAGHEEHVELSQDLCRHLYRRMRLARRLDEEAFALQRQGELGLWLECRGQEAAQVGSVEAVRGTDHIFPSYREHAAALCRGIGPRQLLAQWRGATNSGWNPDDHRFHIYTLVLSAQLLHATGYALGVQLDGADEMVLAYFGDGSSSEGDANEALNWAAVSSAPLLFFCQNNQWAISTSVSHQMRAPLHQRALGFGMESHAVDGNDVLAVYAVTRRAADAARQGSGPALIEAFTYRMGGHSTSDDPTRYRSPGEVESWRERDPILRMELLLERQGWSDDEFRAGVAQECDQLAAETRAACIGIEPVPLEELYASAYVDEPPPLRREREAMAAYLSSFED